MVLFKSILGVAAINFARWLKDKRVRFVFVFIAYMVWMYIWPFTRYGMKIDGTISGWLLPVMFQAYNISIGVSKVILHLGMLLLLCDAPFFSPIMPYMLLRSRRNGWWMGACLYSIAAACVYALFLMLLSMLLVLPVIRFDNEWGSVMNELAFGIKDKPGMDIAIVNEIRIVPRPSIIRYLYPIGAQLYTFVAIWCSFSFLGLLMYLVSLITQNILMGIGIAGVFVFLDPFVIWLTEDESRRWMELLSPVSWTSVERMQSVSRFNLMSIPMALGLYLIIIAVLCIAIWRYSRRVMIGMRR